MSPTIVTKRPFFTVTETRTVRRYTYHVYRFEPLGDVSRTPVTGLVHTRTAIRNGREGPQPPYQPRGSFH